MPSSVVKYFSYDAGARRLRVHFVGGHIYDYLDVPPDVFEAMKRSGSKGTFLNTRIKGKYVFAKVE